jgi:hypothetical protein
MKHWLIGTVAAVALLSGCGKKEQAAGLDSTAAAVEVGDVTLPAVQLRAGNAANAEAALTALSMGQSGDGRVSFASKDLSGATATFSDVEILTGDADDEDEGGVLTAQTLTFSGLDMSDGAASFAQMRLDGVTLGSVGDDEEVAVQITDMQISNPSPALATWVGSLFGEGEPADFPALSELSFDAFSMNNISVAPEADDDIEEFRIDRVDFRDMSENGLGAMIFEGLNFSAADEGNGENVSFSLGSMQVMGIGEVIAKSLATGLSDTDADPSELMSLLASNPGDPGYDSVRIEDFILDASGLEIDLPAYSGDVTRDSQGRAIRSVSNPFKATVSADPEGELGSQLAGQLGLLGYETLVIGGAGDTRIDHETDRVTADVASNYFELEEGFRLSMGGDFGGLGAFYGSLAESDLNELENSPLGFAAMLSELNLHGLELTFKDDSFVDRIFAAAAARDGSAPDDMKTQAKQMLGLAPLFAGEAGVDVDIVTELTGALGSFISDPGTLTLKLDPATPISADMLEDPTQLTKDALGFSASAK